MKPGDFLLGVLDFFAILLPGALATWLAVQYIDPATLRAALSFEISGGSVANDWIVGTAFFLASYALGHFVFMIGSSLDNSYDRWRKQHKPTDADTTYIAARDLHERLNKEIFGGPLTTLKWAKAYVQVNAQHVRAEIDRLEADQKFFRSLVVISAAFASHFFLGESAPLPGVVAIGMGYLAYHRYADQRWKMTELIYATAVIVAASKSAVGNSAERKSVHVNRSRPLKRLG